MVSRLGGYLHLAHRINSRVESKTDSSSICDLREWPKEIQVGSIYKFFKNGFECDIIGGKDSRAFSAKRH